jgi:hypothetical protein
MRIRVCELFYNQGTGVFRYTYFEGNILLMRDKMLFECHHFDGFSMNTGYPWSKTLLNSFTIEF